MLKFKSNVEPENWPDLTEAETRVLKILMSKMANAEEMAEKFEVSSQTIRNVKLLKTRVARRMHGVAKMYGYSTYTWAAAPRFSPKQVADIRSSKASSSKLGKEYGVSPSTIRMVKTGKTYVS